MLRYLSNLFLFPPLDHIVDNISSVKVSHLSYRSCFERRLPSIRLSFIGWVPGFSATGQSRPKAIMGGAGFFSKGKIPGNEVGNRPGRGSIVRLMIPSLANAQGLETIYPDICKWFKDILIVRMRTKNWRRLLTGFHRSDWTLTGRKRNHTAVWRS